ncbi:hypothetical protein A3H75_00650 [Candidatus Uhrbacteria bacterium RIFCSPLOWO2_02_FULL_51_9]|uniref:Uncharacterized protein n=1 Tax=Candidatus Uhrbacteria bacterium RIFCSPLOWO2_02_FULL_51_9 TaxID=1802410 RepID=A0A1F7VF70_9BACT|nr:MAG: hypothetical protein A3H75_00650 [Candidatus Uhrbacteria bacterium RIFCSPLOWO2_02_FULL_51_9]
MSSKILKIIIHSACAFALIVSFVWLAYANSAPSGAVTYVQDFERRTPFISDFWPPERIDPVMRGADGAIRPVVESPVSFFIHPSRRFSTGTIEMIFKLKDAATFELGIETGPEPEDVRVYQWQALESLPGDFWRGTLMVPMSDWWRDENDRHHAQLLVSDLLEKKNVLFVKEVRVTLTGRPRGWREWLEAFNVILEPREARR